MSRARLLRHYRKTGGKGEVPLRRYVYKSFVFLMGHAMTMEGSRKRREWGDEDYVKKKKSKKKKG